jgi:hypothetical protein
MLASPNIISGSKEVVKRLVKKIDGDFLADEISALQKPIEAFS